MCKQETDSGNQEAGTGDEAATVLLVDDDPAIVASVRALLENAGYQILTARNGEEALETFTAHREDIDLIILDLVMPRMSGEECLDKLLEIDPEVKVLGTSGYYIDDNAYQKIEPKVKMFMPKPIEPAILLTLVERIVRGGRS